MTVCFPAATENIYQQTCLDWFAFRLTDDQPKIIFKVFKSIWAILVSWQLPQGIFPAIWNVQYNSFPGWKIGAFLLFYFSIFLRNAFQRAVENLFDFRSHALTISSAIVLSIWESWTSRHHMQLGFWLAF